MTKPARTHDAWGNPIKERPERTPWGRPKTEAPRPKRDPWGHPAKAPQPKLLPECAALFKDVAKLEQARTRDAWGKPIAERGMPSKEFYRAVVEAQAAILEKARPSRPSDPAAAAYVDAVTKLLREQSTTDAEFVAKLQGSASWDHTRCPSPMVIKPTSSTQSTGRPARLERNTTPAPLTPASRLLAENQRTHR